MPLSGQQFGFAAADREPIDVAEQIEDDPATVG